MKVVAAYLLANLGGNASPSADDIKKILSAGKQYSQTRAPSSLQEIIA
jgi:large subunit ribosomal protein LP2